MKIPKSKKDILVKTYLEYLEYAKTEPTIDTEIVKNTVKIFYNLDEDGFNSFEYQTILDMFQIIDNILKVKQDLVISFQHNSIDYAINPDFNDITFAEMVDCNTTDIIKQICILYRPIKKKKGNKYLIIDYNADISIYESLKETLTLDIYIGFITFFLKLNQDMLNYIPNYLMEKGIAVEKNSILETSGDGFHSFMNYVGVT